jgi:hypothetical protein
VRQEIDVVKRRASHSVPPATKQLEGGDESAAVLIVIVITAAVPCARLKERDAFVFLRKPASTRACP